jgi:hypothetical protein
LRTDKSKATKTRPRVQKLPKVGTMSMIKGPGNFSSFQPLVRPTKKKRLALLSALQHKRHQPRGAAHVFPVRLTQRIDQRRFFYTDAIRVTD